ncbi:hypothetical protein A221_26590, partial [Pseudomonas syringae pv. actinidiae ICMP 18801]
TGEATTILTPGGVGTFLTRIKNPVSDGNAVHLSGAALRLTGYRVFDIFTALGLAGLGRFVMKSTPMLPRSSSRRLGVCDGDTAPAMTTR